MKNLGILAAVAIAAIALTGSTLAQRAGTGGERYDRDDVITREGTITEVARPFATLKADGEEYTLHLGPQWFWARNGYVLAVGDEVKVTGQAAREGDISHLYLHAIEKGGKTWTFADADGVPLWAGAGRGPGHGRGYGHYGHGRGYGYGPCAGGSASAECPGCPRCPDCPGCPRCAQGSSN